jgi:soluble lytic murein transglycosylase-like protein
MVRTALLAAALCALTPSLAHAQLYSWTDANGRLIISDQPRDPAAKTYLVFGSTGEKATSFRSTKPASPRAAVYDDLIVDNANQHDLSPDFVRAVIQAESAFNPYARSPKGAMGLMQLMPQTATLYRVLDAYNPAENIRAGVAYLKSLMTRYNNDVSLALAAYNAGPTAVEKYGRKIPPYRETRNYVAKIKKQADTDGPVHSPTAIYRTVRIVNGHETVSYSNKPSPGATRVGTR